jgi:hypothetical protein
MEEAIQALGGMNVNSDTGDISITGILDESKWRTIPFDITRKYEYEFHNVNATGACQMITHVINRSAKKVSIVNMNTVNVHAASCTNICCYCIASHS